jgi:hypothetical protein
MTTDPSGADDRLALPEPAVSYGTVRSLATRILALEHRGLPGVRARRELLEHATTLASLIASNSVRTEIHVGLSRSGIPCDGRADAPVRLVVKRYVDPPVDPVVLGDLVLDGDGRLAVPHTLSTGERIALRRDPAAFVLRGAETLLEHPDALRPELDAPQHASDRAPTDRIGALRERVTALLREHEAHNVAADVAAAPDGQRLAQVAQAAFDDAAITDTHAVLLGLLAVATEWPAPIHSRGFLDVLTLLLERVERLNQSSGPRFTVAPDTILAAIVDEHGGPEFAERDQAGHLIDLEPGNSARSYLADAIDAGGVVVPAGHHIRVEGDDDEDGSYLKVSVARDGRRPQLSWGWEEVKYLPRPGDDADAIAALRVLLAWLVDELNGLLTHA